MGPVCEGEGGGRERRQEKQQQQEEEAEAARAAEPERARQERRARKQKGRRLRAAAAASTATPGAKLPSHQPPEPRWEPLGPSGASEASLALPSSQGGGRRCGHAPFLEGGGGAAVAGSARPGWEVPTRKPSSSSSSSAWATRLQGPPLASPGLLWLMPLLLPYC